MEKSGEQTPGPATEPGPGAADTPTRLSNEHLSGSMPSHPAKSTHAAVQEGTVLGDRYRIIQLLGKGGMGEVYLAEHIAIGRKVAIKTLNAANLHDRPDLAGRFLREARTSSMVRHPNIVDITDFGHTPPEPPFFVMEYLEGEDLKSMLRREGTLPWERARDIVLQVCAALATAHKQGVVHRDMKPDNVFLIRQAGAEHVKVLDFGIAKITTSDTVQEATQTGVLLGTPEYMSPEQAQDLPLDARSDIYATGVILYRMLTGRVPFQAKSFMTVLARHIQEKPVPPREVNPGRGITEAQEAVILRCLAKLPEDRFQSAEELAEALRSADAAPKPGLVVPRPTAPSGNRWLAPLLSLVVLAGLGVVAYMLFVRPDPQDMPEPPATPVAEAKPEPPKEPPPVVTPPEPVKTDPPPETPPDPVPETSPTPTVADKADKPGKDDKKGKKTPTPKTTTAKPVAALTGADLNAAAAGVSGALKECSSLGIAGTTIKVDVEVGTDGKVTAATAHKPIHGSALGNCVEKAARKARFPALTSAQKTTISLRLPAR